MELFTERHQSKIVGILSCFDRVVITGSIPDIGYDRAMTGYLFRNSIRIFDYSKWAGSLRDELHENAESVARKNGLEIEYITKKNFRKEDRVREIIEKRGTHPGVVHVFSALEPCTTYKPRHDKTSKRNFLKACPGKCLHYYFYFILPDLGLCYLRVPTWAPFRLQFYYNGHNELAAKLDKKGFAYRVLDNAFVWVDDFEAAQKLADTIRPDRLHKQLDRNVEEFCPIIRHFSSGYHWSLMQVEYATDIVFRKQTELAPIYEELVRTAVHSVKPDHIATFLGRKLTQNFEDEMGNDFHTRIEGTRIKHHMGKAAIKMYDKQGLVLRIETTTNDVSFFKHHRKVVHRDGTSSRKVAQVKKSIYSLPDLRELMRDSNDRYLEFISAIDDPTLALKNLLKIAEPNHDGKRSYRGFNLFQGEDLKLFQLITRGEFNISGFQNRHLRNSMPTKTGHQISRMLKRLHKHGLIKKIARTYKYYLTALGRKIVAIALKLREMYIIPSLRGKLST